MRILSQPKFLLKRILVCVAATTLLVLSIGFPASNTSSASLPVPAGWRQMPSNPRYIYRIQNLPTNGGEESLKKLLVANFVEYQNTGYLDKFTIWSYPKTYSISPVVDAFPETNLVLFSVRMKISENKIKDFLFLHEIYDQDLTGSFSEGTKSVFSDGIEYLQGASSNLERISFRQGQNETFADLTYRTAQGNPLLKTISKGKYSDIAEYRPDPSNSLDDVLEKFYFGPLPDGATVVQSSEACSVELAPDYIKTGTKYSVNFDSVLFPSSLKSHELCVLDRTSSYPSHVAQLAQKNKDNNTTVKLRYGVDACNSSGTSCSAYYLFDNFAQNFTVSTYVDATLPEITDYSLFELSYLGASTLVDPSVLRTSHSSLSYSGWSGYDLRVGSAPGQIDNALLYLPFFQMPSFMAISGEVKVGQDTFAISSSSSELYIQSRSVSSGGASSIKVLRYATSEHIRAAVKLRAIYDNHLPEEYAYELRRSTDSLFKAFVVENTLSYRLFKKRILGLDKSGNTYILRWLNEFDDAGLRFTANLKRDSVSKMYWITLYDRERNVLTNEALSKNPKISEIDAVINRYR